MTVYSRTVMKTFAKRLTDLRKAHRLTQLKFGNAIGVSRGAVANWETGGGIEREHVVAISTKFDVSLDWLEHERGQPPAVLARNSNGSTVDLGNPEDAVLHSGRTTPANATLKATQPGAWRKVPVFGQAVAGVDGEFLMNGNVLYEAFAPPNIAAVSDAYGVRCSGDSMTPRYYDGEVVFVDPSKTPRRGDFVVVQIQMADGEAPWGYIKQFVRHNSKELVLTQFNPEKEIVFPHAKVGTVHVIVMGGNA